MTRFPISRWSNITATSGHVRRRRDRALQYDGVEIGFFEYVRVAISGGKMEYNPVYEVKATMRTLCNDLKDRRSTSICDRKGRAEEGPAAKAAQQHLRRRRSRMETYSTPSRDARIKTAAAEFYIGLQKILFFWEKRDPALSMTVCS